MSPAPPAPAAPVPLASSGKPLQLKNAETQPLATRQLRQLALVGAMPQASKQCLRAQPTSVV